MSLLNWPQHLERTPDNRREHTAKYQAGLRQTKREVRAELEKRMDVDEWRIDDVSGGDDPGVVVRWSKDGRDHAVACDHYTERGDNLRTVFLWLRETRKSGDRPVKTGRDQFAAAALPGEVDSAAEPADPPPHETLGVARGADPEVVEAVARRLKKKHHPDSGEDPDESMFKRVCRAEEAMLA